VILESKLLKQIAGLRHGFSTRLGGVSEGRYATLNLDPNDPHAKENLERFLAMVGLPRGTELFQLNQVHGATVIAEGRIAFSSHRPDADAVITQRHGVALGVRTADCVPVLVALADARKTRAYGVAAVHAGWRGATAGIVANTVAALRELSMPPVDVSMYFAVGPAIGVDAFEVGEEVIEAARASLGGPTPPMKRGPSGKPHLDLRGLIVEQLRRLDIPRDRIELVGGCTYEAPALYFSHRRDRGVTGRHLSAIALSS
jgi:YfiH family protein